MLAVIPVRDGELPAGALETIAECGGRVVLVGDRLDGVDLIGTGCAAGRVRSYAPGLMGSVIGGAPRGRADRGAACVTRRSRPGASNRPCAPSAARRRRGVDRARTDHRASAGWDGVARSRGATAAGRDAPAGAPRCRAGTIISTGRGTCRTVTLERREVPHATSVAVRPPDVTTIDLTEADRIVAGGAGLDSPDRFEQLAASPPRSARRWARPG